MQDLFELAAGSIRGRNHGLTGRNNQDAWCSLISEQSMIAVVCDGCGSAPHSEVGAKLGAWLTVAILAQVLIQNQWQSPDAWLSTVQVELLAQFQTVVKAMGGDWRQTLHDYFLFTIVGAVLTPTEAMVFSLGDGAIWVNDQLTQLGPFPGNAPPYLAYSLTDLESFSLPLSFQVQHRLPLEQVQSIAIGSDGTLDLAAAADRCLPGKTETVGGIDQFWQDDRYFTNPDALRRRLALINREVTKPDWQARQLVRQSGLLPDDTTLVVMRRRIFV